MSAHLGLAALGVASYVFYFHRGEHHMLAPTYLSIAFFSTVGSIIALVKLKTFSIFAATALVTAYSSSYLLGLYSSLLIWRIWLSPLNKFPGPWQAKISSLWYAVETKNFDGNLVNERLHKQYGKYVRVGPNDLSISDADVHELAYGTGTKFRKGAWYDNSIPFTSMHTTRDKAIHDRRRKIWVPAFSDKALRDYEPKVRIYVDKLIQRIRDNGPKPMDVTKWFNLFAFDVMGQLAFGKGYNMLDSGERHWALDLLVEGMEAAPTRLPVWLFRILLQIPFAAQGFFKFLKFCRDELDGRIKSDQTGQDITGWLLKSYTNFDGLADDPMFQGDSRLIIVAGSDTTSATLTYLFYELAKSPAQVKKLRDELKPLAKEGWGDVDVRNAHHL